jgi:nucleoid DNA-binding protein
LRETLRANMLQQRQCLTLSPKPSLIDGIPLHGGGERVNKSGLIDAISNATSLTTCETETAVNALVRGVATGFRVGSPVLVIGIDSSIPTQRGARMEHRGPQENGPHVDHTEVRRAQPTSVALKPVDKVARRVPATTGRKRAPARKNSEAIGQQGRTARSGQPVG